MTTKATKTTKKNGGGYIRDKDTGKAVKAEVGQLIPLTVFKRMYPPAPFL